MKNKIVFYICMILLMVAVGVSAFAITVGINAKYETEETKAFKEVLELLENNRGKSTKKGYLIDFLQQFEYEEKIDSEDELVDFSANYEANGTFVLSYDKDDDKKVSVEKGFDTFIQYANGFISGVQSEKYKIFNEETDKYTNEKRTDEHNRGVQNKFVYDTNDNLVSVMSETQYQDYNDSSKDYNDKFYGIISKKSLHDAVEIKSLSQAINRLMFIDAWSSVNSLLSIMHSTFVGLNPKSYKGLYNYINNKDFEYERKDNSIIIRYRIDLDSSLKENSPNDLENITITVEVDTKTSEITYFKFDLANYFASLLNADAEGTTFFKSDVKAYYVEGKILDNTLERMDTANITYKEYKDEEKYDFIDQFLAHALPTRIDIYNA